MRTARLIGLLLALLPLLVPWPARAEDWTPSREGVWPLQPQPRVVAGFDPPAVRWGSGHRGVDLDGWPGAPVRTALGGEIAYVGSIAGRGIVTVRHGGLRTTYQPVVSTLEVGTRVSAGQVIGTLARTGSHCFPGSCLHWGLLRGETYLDPLLLVGGGPVRLLPLTSTPAGTGTGTAGLAGHPGAV